MTSIKRRALLALSGLAILLPAATSAQPMDKARLLTQAQAAYYTVGKAGFAGARCRVVPDWAVVLGKPRGDPNMQTAFTLLEGLQFAITLGSDGTAKLVRTDSTTAPNPQADSGFQQITQGLQQAIGGFFETWRLFMVSGPIPDPASDVAITRQAGGYRLVYSEGGAHVVSDIGPKGAVSNVAVQSAAFNSAVRPQFVQDPAGLVLSAYVADYTPTGGPGKTHLDVTIGYPMEKTVRIPSKIGVDGLFDGTPIHMRLVMSDCQVTRMPGR
jgi:hypothetical protein